MVHNMRSYLSVLKKVLWNPRHGAFLFLGMAGVGIVAVLISDYHLIRTVLSTPATRLAEKSLFLSTLFSDPIGTYGGTNIVLFLVIDFLFVLNLLLLYRLFKEKIFLHGKSIWLNISALFVAVVGLGCFSCGSVLFFFLLSVFGVAVSSVWVGTEVWVLILSIMLFCISICISLKKLIAANVC